MLARLRHHSVVGRDHQHRHIDSADSGDHRLDEALVARYVNYRRLLAQKGEAQLNGNPPRLLFRGLVGVGAGQGFDQQRLAVIDMPRSADNSVRHTLTFLAL